MYDNNRFTPLYQTCFSETYRIISLFIIHANIPLSHLHSIRTFCVQVASPKYQWFPNHTYWWDCLYKKYLMNVQKLLIVQYVYKSDIKSGRCLLVRAKSCVFRIGGQMSGIIPGHDPR